jgi:membrane protease subunit (stomatin/prohibitin family)
MKAIGNLHDYTRMKAAEALGTAAANPGGLGAAGVGVGAGFGMGGMMADAMREAMRPGGAPAQGSGEAAAPARSVADQLRDLAALHKEGILTPRRRPSS